MRQSRWSSVRPWKYVLTMFFVFVFGTPASTHGGRRTPLRRQRNKAVVGSHAVVHSNGKITTGHHIYPPDAAQSSRFKAEGMLSKDLFDPHHPDEPYLRTLSQFFKVYGSAEERKVQDGFKVMKASYNGKYMSKVTRFTGRASFFNKDGLLHRYQPMLHELAEYHGVPKHNATNFAMSFMETNADKWNMRVKPTRVDPEEAAKQPENQLLKTWEEEEETDAGNAVSLVDGMADKEEEEAENIDMKIEQLEKKMRDKPKKEQLKSNGMPKDQEDTGGKVGKNGFRFTRVPKDVNVLEENEKAIRKELEASKKRVGEAVSKRSKGKAEKRFDVGTDEHVIDVIERAANHKGPITNKHLGDAFDHHHARFVERHMSQFDNHRDDPNIESSSSPFVERGDEPMRRAPDGFPKNFDPNKTHIYTVPPGKFNNDLPAPSMPAKDKLVVRVTPAWSPRCKQSEKLQDDKVTCHGLHEKHVVNTMLLQPDVLFGGNVWRKDQSGGFLFTGKFADYKAAEFHIFAPPDHYLQWHFPRGKESFVQLKIRLGFKEGYPGRKTCKGVSYAADVMPVDQKRLTETNSFFAVGGEDFRGKLEGNHRVAWDKEGLTLTIDKYAINDRSKPVTSCFKALRVLVRYDSSKVCDGFEWAGGSLSVDASPFGNDSEYKAGPYLRLVDSCPFVHNAAVLAAKALRDGRPLSARLCKVLGHMRLPGSKLEQILKTRCPASNDGSGSGSDDAADLGKEALELLMQKKHLDGKKGNEEISKLKKQAEQHRKRAAGLRIKLPAGNCTDPCEGQEGRPDKRTVCSSPVKAGWVGGPALPEAVPLIQKEREMQAKRAKLQKVKEVTALKFESAAGGKLAGAMAAPIGPALGLVIRNAIAMIISMIMGMWMGKQTAPWRYDGSHNMVCRVEAVEFKNKCNLERDKALQDTMLPPPFTVLCNIFCFIILLPPIEILFKMPPPVGIGPLPPFVVPPCLAVQGPPEKKSCDDIIQSMIEKFIFSIIKLVAKIVQIALVMASAAAGAASAKSAAADAFIEFPELRGNPMLRSTEDYFDSQASSLSPVTKRLFRFVGGGNEKPVKRGSAESASDIVNFLDMPPSLAPKGGESEEAAEDKFKDAAIAAAQADFGHAKAKAGLRDLQLRQAENSKNPWAICRARINENKMKEQIKKTEEALKKRQEEKSKKLGKEFGDNRDEEDIHENPGTPFGVSQAKCPMYSLFRCTCASMPPDTTLDPKDCQALKAVKAAEYQAEKDMIFAAGEMGKKKVTTGQVPGKKQALEKPKRCCTKGGKGGTKCGKGGKGGQCKKKGKSGKGGLPAPGGGDFLLLGGVARRVQRDFLQKKGTIPARPLRLRPPPRRVVRKKGAKKKTNQIRTRQRRLPLRKRVGPLFRKPKKWLRARPG